MIMETKLKFKVGDKVRVKSLEWYNSNKDEHGLVYIDKQGIVFDKTMARFCGKIVQIEEVNRTGYFICGYSGFLEDWMLEDEAVTEEKQEVEQLKQKNMETKEMTQEEVFLYLNNTKIICTSKEEAVKVQEKLFELGIEWLSGVEEIFEEKYLLFINGKHKLQSCFDIRIWVKDVNRQMEPSEILAIQIKEEEKPKFDFSALQPFDKVLVRNTATDVWCARFFDRCELGVYDTTSQESWIFCIPYNEETKHLHGTNQEEPEFYRI